MRYALRLTFCAIMKLTSLTFRDGVLCRPSPIVEKHSERAKDLKGFERWCLDQNLGVRRGNFGKWEWRGDRADGEGALALVRRTAKRVRDRSELDDVAMEHAGDR